jgi:hypothetical protein
MTFGEVFCCRGSEIAKVLFLPSLIRGWQMASYNTESVSIGFKFALAFLNIGCLVIKSPTTCYVSQFYLMVSSSKRQPQGGQCLILPNL